MAAESAGILMYRGTEEGLQVLLVHPGGPFWRNRDNGAWSIPKGEIAPGETAEAVARREFEEELGAAPSGVLVPLGVIRQKAGKRVHAFALHGNLDSGSIRSNTFDLEWPPRSGRRQTFPEVDRAAWFDLATARLKLNPAQTILLDRLLEFLA